MAWELRQIGVPFAFLATHLPPLARFPVSSRGSAGVSPAAARACLRCAQGRLCPRPLAPRLGPRSPSLSRARGRLCGGGSGTLPPQRARRPRYKLLATADRRGQSLQLLCRAPRLHSRIKMEQAWWYGFRWLPACGLLCPAQGSLCDNSIKPVAPQALWSAAACCRFGQAGLPAVHQGGLAVGREQARWGKAAASCRTPKLRLERQALLRRGVIAQAQGGSLSRLAR
jgi:hypothetical protein